MCWNNQFIIQIKRKINRMISGSILKDLLECDVAIIGSGIVGLSCAASILERNPKKKVIVLERGLLPTGATTKNAGILSIGNFIDILEDIKEIGEAEVRRKIENQRRGINKLLERLGTEATDYQLNGTYELFNDNDLHLVNEIDKVNKVLLPVFKENVFSLDNSKIQEFSVNDKVVKAIVFSKFDATIDSGRTIKNLLKYTRNLGAIIITGAEVVSYEKAPTKGVIVKMKKPFSSMDGEKNSCHCKKLIIATNAFSNPILHQKVDLVPARGQVFVTKPIPGLKIKGAFHFEEGYYYGRTIGDRVLFGGARNTDFAGETTERFENTEKIITRVKQILEEVILPNHKVEIEHQWAGIMGFGRKSKQRIIEELEEGVFCAIRFSGFGMSIATHVGEMFGEMVLSDNLHPSPKL